MIELYYSGDIKDVIEEFESYIKDEVLALSIEENTSLDKEYDLNGKLVKLDVKKA